MSSLEPLMRRNFLEYASYVVVDRAIPALLDGCKPVQRRILHTLSTMDDGKFIKVANVIGETMKLHPHGDASIGDALVVIANKGQSPDDPDLGYFIERQGNFGNFLTGDGAAAPRYIECRLTALAKETLFNPALTRMTPSYDGRKQEPEMLPAKLPVLLLLGTEGIAVGMATTILPHNLDELLLAQIAYLKGQTFTIYPDFPQGGLCDVSEYNDGRGKVRVRARIEADGDKKVIIKEIPFGTTAEGVMDSIEAAYEKGKVKISGISDRTTSGVELEVTLARGAYADEVIPQLFAYTACEQSISSNIVVIRDQKPFETTVSTALKIVTEQLKETLKAELERELDDLIAKQHALTLEQIFIENRVYKRIEEASTAAAVDQAVKDGMAPFASRFVRALTDDDVVKLLDIRIKRISAYDIAKNRKDIADILNKIKEIRAKLANLTATTIAWIDHLRQKYGKKFPRRTEITTFQVVDKKAVANANLKVVYDSTTGFLGTQVKGGDRELKVSEYDRIIAIMQDGTYKIFAAPEKTVLEGKLLHLAVFDQEKGLELTVVYRDGDKLPWCKRTAITSFIKDREYELIKDGKIDRLFLGTHPTGTVTCEFTTVKGQRVFENVADLGAIEPCGLGARGTRLAEKPTAKLVFNLIKP